MKKSFLAAALLCSSFAFAADKTGSVELEAARSTAAQHFHEAAQRLSEASSSTAAATHAIRSCKNGRLQLQFSDALAKLEHARKALEAGRRHTQSYREALESVRRMVESSRAEESYAQRLTAQYLTPMDTRLVPMLDSYTAGITAYAGALGKYAEFCGQPGYTAEKGKAFVAEVTTVIDALDTRAGQLVSDATVATTEAQALAPTQVAAVHHHHRAK
jgi:chromosome segregation ATPase